MSTSSTFDNLPVSPWFVVAIAVAVVAYLLFTAVSPLIDLVSIWATITLFFGVWAYGEYLYRLLWAGFE